jgi:hypothetical protein
MKPINGVYLGWIPPHSKSWEPLYRTIRCERGYKSERTGLYAPAIERYPGLALNSDFYPDPLDLPFALERRTPLVRPDYERDARLLNLPYPNPDLFEFIGRTGGLFSGDNFSVCPIVEPNDDGSYSYEFGLWKIDRDVRDGVNENTRLKAIARTNEPTILTADVGEASPLGNRPLGEFSPHFTLLGDKILNVKIVRIGRPETFTGSQVVVSFDTPINLYATPAFAVVSEAVMVNV